LLHKQSEDVIPEKLVPAKAGSGNPGLFKAFLEHRLRQFLQYRRLFFVKHTIGLEQPLYSLEKRFFYPIAGKILHISGLL